MKMQNLSLSLGALLALGLAWSASAALVTVSSTETWDGVANPHSGDGVTLTGTGTTVDPAIYTIPDGMLITSTGKIVLHSTSDYSIKFVIQGGDLQMDAGAILNPERYKIRSSLRYFTLDLSATNSITGAGQIGPITDRDSTPRDLTLQNVKNVSLASIDMHTENANTGPADFRFINITASGAVLVSGTVDNSDRDSGGDGCGDITIKANTIDVNNVDARGFRDDPPGRDPYSGNVTLLALSPVGNYDPNDGVNNAGTNKLTVRGAIRTMAVDPETINGNVNLQSVVLQLVQGAITNIPPFATKSLRVGVVRDTAIASDLFVDVSSSGETVAYDVQWGGSWTPPAGSAPVFTTDPVIKADATQAVVYAQSLIGNATDADLDPLTFAKLSGPAWLTVAPNGALSGTPALANACTNTWQISVTDGTRFDTAILQIFVVAGPRWPGNNLTYANAEQNVAYAGTLATNVIYDCGALGLTYSKVSGPAWLSVAADGTLSGTPTQTDVLANAFTVSVTDGTFPAVNANVNIFVNGSPKFPNPTIAKGNAYVTDSDYSVRSQTLAGSAIDPQDPANPATLTWAKVSGPAWLTVAADGALSGNPLVGDLGTNIWTISAANAYPATTATLKIVVKNSQSGPLEITAREFWDGVANPHAAEGVTLTGTGTEADPATYTLTNGLYLYGDGQIYTSQALAQDTEANPLHIRFVIAGDLNLDTTNNAFVTGVHNRALKRKLFLDLNGTNSIVGAGRIIGLGSQVDGVTFPFAFNRDCPRLLVITNVNNVSLYDINVRVVNAGTQDRDLLIKANGKVKVTSGIDNSDRDTGGNPGSAVEVFASQIEVNGVDTRTFRTSAARLPGKIRLNALNPPYQTGGNNSISNMLTVTATLRPTNPFDPTNWNTINLEAVVLNLGTNAILDSPAPGKTTVNVGIIQGGVSAGYLYSNVSTNVFTSAIVPNYVVNWFVPSLAITTGPGAGQVTLTWTGTGYDLQTNSSVANPGGWGTVPGATSPAVRSVLPGTLFYRLKSQ